MASLPCLRSFGKRLCLREDLGCLWFLSKSRNGGKGSRKRKDEILFIDASRLGILIPGSRKQKQLSDQEIEQIAAVYQEYRTKAKPKEVPGFCKVAAIDEIREHDYVLTPGRYVGSQEAEEDDELFEDKMKRLTAELEHNFSESRVLEEKIRQNLRLVQK